MPKNQDKAAESAFNQLKAIIKERQQTEEKLTEPEHKTHPTTIWYDLELISNQDVKEKKLYVERIDATLLRYKVIGPDGKLKEDHIKHSEINNLHFPKPLTSEWLNGKEVKAAILAITSKRDHISTIDYLDIKGHSLLYYAVSMGDLEKVKDCVAEGANIHAHFPDSPIEIALQNGHLEVAQYLIELGVDCSAINLATGKDIRTKNWLQSLMSQAWHQSYPNFPEEISSPAVENQFFNRSTSTSAVLGYLAQIGDIEQMKSAIKKHEQLYLQNTNFLLRMAASNKQIEMIKFLVKNKAEINPKISYSATLLMIAVNNNDHQLIDYLLSQSIELDAQDENKYTALAYAIINNDLLAIEKLINHGATTTLTTIDGDTILHLAMECNANTVGNLLKIPGVPELIAHKNIYGFTPLDIAMHNKNDAILKLLLSNTDLSLIQQDPRYGVKPISTAQNGVIKAQYYYLQSDYRDTQYLSIEGNCSALSFLKGYYGSKGMGSYFFNTLRFMANWNGDKEELRKQFHDIPQAPFYKNLEELFEQWTNDSIWLQHSKLTSIDSLDQTYSPLYTLIKSNTDLAFQPVYQDNEKGEVFRTQAQIQELFAYFLRMPAYTHFFLGGGQHATSGYKNSNDIFDYYDPNHLYPLENTSDFKETYQRILDYKYIRLGKFAEKFDLRFTIATFHDKKNITPFNILCNDEFPKSKDDASRFRELSPNQFTPLHVAIITNDFTALKKLIADGFCDINAKDCLGRTALQIAFENRWGSIIKLIFDIPELDPSHAREITKKIGDKELRSFLENHKNITNFESFFTAVKDKKIDEVKQFLVKNPSYVNLRCDSKLPLIIAIEANDLSLIELLLKHGADVTIAEEYESYYYKTTPLSVAIKANSDCVPQLVAQLKNIDQLDENKHSALHYAARFHHLSLIKDFLAKGADVNLHTPNGDSIIDKLEQTIFGYDEDNKNSSLKILLPLYHFDLTNAKELSQLKEYLFLFSTQSKPVFSALLAKGDKEIINNAKLDDNTLLHHIILKPFERANKSGAQGNTLFSKSDTPLTGSDSQEYEIIKLLLEFKPDLTIKNNQNYTVIDLVNNSDDEQLKEIFINKGLISASYKASNS